MPFWCALSSSVIQADTLEIEDLLRTSRQLGACPYYAARRALPYEQLVLLPYNLLLSRESREALGIDLHVLLSFLC